MSWTRECQTSSADGQGKEFTQCLFQYLKNPDNTSIVTSDCTNCHKATVILIPRKVEKQSYQ